jgi:DNA-damage-inducible protein D
MPDKDLVSLGNKSFEDLKKTNEYGAEYWSAREIQPFLGYTQWRRFEDAVKRAITSCKSSGNDPAYHFADAGKVIDIGKGGRARADRTFRRRMNKSKETFILSFRT